MDPNATLAEIREAIETWRNSDHGSPAELDAVDVLIERFGHLDEWLTWGGFLPADWTRKA